MLLDVAFVMDFCAFRKETLASFLAAATEDVTTSFSAHACAESMLALAHAFRRLIGAFHG